MSRHTKAAKQICDFILNQEPVITEYSKFTGFFRFDDSVVGDYFNANAGYTATTEVMDAFYLKEVDGLSAMEWQHAVADYSLPLKKGISGIIIDIDKSLEKHTEPEKIEFLNAMKCVAKAMIKWAHKGSDRVKSFSEKIENKEYKSNLEKLSDALLKVPEHKPSNFYEALLSVYVCFSAEQDSIGTVDRYLYPFYKKDIKDGLISKEEAKEYLQEFFLMLQSATPKDSANFTKGGQSHFCIGGYLPDGTDGFNDLSQLVLESLMELNTYIPQITMRWTAKTPKEIFRYVLDCERKDRMKRIAFQNDEKRIKGYTEICKIPYEIAVGYTLTGCNELAFAGQISASTSKMNIAHCLDTLFYKKAEETEKTKSFSEFYELFLQELYSDLDKGYEYDDKYNLERAKDYSYISSLFFNGCIEKGLSLSQGAGEYAVSSPMLIGMINVIDSLIIVKQFVFDEKIVSMSDLISALKENWYGYDELRLQILKKGDFFGNDTSRSNEVAQKLYQSIYNYLKDKRTVFGYPILIGDHTGYNEHFEWFGKKIGATPDGRYAGSPLKFGLGQSEGKDRKGLTALMNSIAQIDNTGISSGATATNFMLDELLIKNDEYFEKTVDMLEAYFKNGGIHFQLNYVSKEELIAAKKILMNIKICVFV